MREQLEILKSELKIDAKNLSLKKVEMKQVMRDNINQAYVLQGEVITDKRILRHKHIAYCLSKGTSYELIEPKCGADNKPWFPTVKNYVEKYGLEVKEELRKW